jgi:hypothetical protein
MPLEFPDAIRVVRSGCGAGVPIRRHEGRRPAEGESASAFQRRPGCESGGPLKKAIEALRKRVEGLEKKQKLPGQERHKIVVTSPTAKAVVVTEQHAGKIRAQRHIEVRALATGYI